MQQIKLKVLKVYEWKPMRDNLGKITHISIYDKAFNSNLGNYNLKYFSKEAKEYIFSKYPLELSTLEKELL